MKKSFIFVFICLLFGAFSTELSAQSEPEWMPVFSWTQVYCDGEVLGYAWGNMYFHRVRHFNKDGDLRFIIYQLKGEAECDFSNEKFNYKEKGKIIFDKEIENYVLHLKGDQGSRYMMHISIDWDTGEWIFGPTNCK